jgi:hypothetical protein
MKNIEKSPRQTMKFIILESGYIFNLDRIQLINSFEIKMGPDKGLKSWIVDIQGNSYPFLELPENFTVQGVTLEFTKRHLNLLTPLILSQILKDNKRSLFFIEETKEEVWDAFIKVIIDETKTRKV